MVANEVIAAKLPLPTDTRKRQGAYPCIIARLMRPGGEISACRLQILYLDLWQRLCYRRISLQAVVERSKDFLVISPLGAWRQDAHLLQKYVDPTLSGRRFENPGVPIASVT